MKISKASKILAVLMVLVLTLGFASCSAGKKNSSNDNSDIIPLLAQEPNSLDEATALHKKLMEAENKIFTDNSALWEKVFLSANKNSPMIEDGKNYGDFLLDTIEGAKSQFSADELKTLKDGAEQIKEIEGKLTILEQKYPGCGSTPGSGESVGAEEAGMGGNTSKLTQFPSFRRK